MTKLPAISEHKGVRFTMLFFLYLAQGLPIGLFLFAIPAWMAEFDASVADIGYFSFLATLPWTLKFVNGFFLDRFVYLPMGRRRAWLLGALFFLIFLMFVLAFVNPGPQDLTMLSVLAFAIMFATTYQDAAIDGMAADLVPEEERATASGMMFGGQVIGIALGTALTGYLISTVGFSISIQVLALLISIVFTAVLIIRERPNEKLLPWLPGEASEASKKLQAENLREIFTTVAKALLRIDSLKLIAVMLLSSISYGLFTSVMPKMANELAGWSTQEYSSLSGTGNLIAGFFCVFIFGVLADRLGRKKIILSLLALQCLMIGIAMTFQDLWNTDGFITTAGVSVITLRYGIAVVVAAIAMSLCDLKVSATQFTLYMACSNLGLSIAYALVGVLDEMDGYFALLLAFAGVSVLALVMATTLNVGEETNYANKS